MSTPYEDLLKEAAGRPFAAIVGCVDSRVPPELVFDRGLGDLFVARVAGSNQNAQSENAVHDNLLNVQHFDSARQRREHRGIGGRELHRP